MSAPACPTCSQPATAAFADGPWECRNEACPEFGQRVRADEPPTPDAPDTGRPTPPQDPPSAER